MNHSPYYDRLLQKRTVRNESKKITLRQSISPTEVIASTISGNMQVHRLAFINTLEGNDPLQHLNNAINTMLNDTITDCFGYHNTSQEFYRPLNARNEAAKPKKNNHLPQSNISPPQKKSDIDESFWDLWLEHHDFLRRYCAKLLFNYRNEIDDVMSTTMLKGSQAYNEKSIKNVKAWLTRLLHNNCMDVLRVAQKNQQRVNMDISIYPDEHVENINSSAKRPHDTMSYIELVKELLKTLETLPDKLKEPFILRFIELSYDNISEHLNLNNCTVRKRVQLAREAIKESLQEHL